MIAAFLCLVVALVLIAVNGAEGNWPAVIVCVLGLWLVSGGGERWLKRREARRRGDTR